MKEPSQKNIVLTTAIMTAVISAIVSAIVTVCLQKYLNVVFPTPLVIQQKEYSASPIPPLSVSFAYTTSANPAESRLFGLIKDLPTYYYDLSLGNISADDTGVIGVSIDFPKPVRAAAAFLPIRTRTYENTTAIHFQTSELKSNFGTTIQIAVKAEDLPDINKIQVTATSQEGDFTKISKAIYDKVFKPVKQ